MKRAWVSKRLDLSPSDWLFAVGACLAPGVPDVTSTVEARWSPQGRGMVGLSVRSLFDLFLGAARWDPGDRIVFTAVTVGDMPRIARHHGLEVVSVDIDPGDASPDVDALRAAVTPRTRAVVFTHLYGARLGVDEAMAVAREHGLLFIEDCAEAYAGPEWTGHPDSDLTLFSFGPIKTATALGGGLARVADVDILARMREIAAGQPVQSTREYLGRCLKYGLLAVATTPVAFALMMRILEVVGPGHDELLHRLTRGFPGPEFFRRIRRRPSRALVRTLQRRLAQGDAPARRRVAPGERLVNGLAGLEVPTGGVRPHAYWLIPLVMDDPAALVARLNELGFNGTPGRALAVVESDGVPGGEGLPGARRLFGSVVFLPFSPDMPGEVLDRLADAVQGEAERQRR
jgi:dTDP-4-amino-4,6-dideoxygalactose transaminase